MNIIAKLDGILDDIWRAGAYHLLRSVNTVGRAGKDACLCIINTVHVMPFTLFMDSILSLFS